MPCAECTTVGMAAGLRLQLWRGMLAVSPGEELLVLFFFLLYYYDILRVHGRRVMLGGQRLVGHVLDAVKRLVAADEAGGVDEDAAGDAGDAVEVLVAEAAP